MVPVGSAAANTQSHCRKGCSLTRSGQRVSDKTIKVKVGRRFLLLEPDEKWWQGAKGRDFGATQGTKFAWMLAARHRLVGTVGYRQKLRIVARRQVKYGLATGRSMSV